MPLPIVLVMHQDGGERTGPVWDQQEGRDGSPVFVMGSDPEAAVVVFLDHGVRLERYGVMRYAELQKLTDFSAESINCHTCLKRARDTSLAVRIRSPNTGHQARRGEGATPGGYAGGKRLQAYVRFLGSLWLVLIFFANSSRSG